MKNLVLKLLTLVVFLFKSVILSSQSQFIECETGAMQSDPIITNECDNSSFSEVCIRVKFHIINNSNDPLNRPTDQQYAELLDQINKGFENVKIHFTIDQGCISELSNTNIKTTSDLYYATASPNGSHTIPRDLTSINIFTTQNNLTSPPQTEPVRGVAEYQYKYFYSIFDAKVMAHEMGHMFGLIHTHGAVSYDSLQHNQWECKNGTNNSTKGDKIKDTPADPFAMDVDGDGATDHFKWVNNCVQSNNLLNTYVGGCQGDLTPWNIPINNFMSYYFDCRSEFTPCQINAMRNDLIANISNTKSGIILDCEDDPYNLAIVCKDITISIPTVKSSETLSLCKDQKIIITPDGSLTLNHCLLTIKTQNNTNCPDFIYNIGNWDGIYIVPAAYGSAQYPGGPTSPTGGRLNVTQNSIIEYSDNGIQAPGSHNGILISNSKMHKNGMAIYSNGPGGLVASGSVNITGSEIISSESSKPVLIRMNGSNLTIQSGSTIKNITSEGITGIKSYNGRLTVRNSTVKDFGVGIDKELNGGVGIGFVIDANHILGNLTSVRNTSSGVTATKNFFQGQIQQFGKAYGRWYANNFKREVLLDNPSLSYSFTENQFDGSRLEFSKNQSLTDARCNIWKNTGIACDGRPTSIKPSWGSQQISSGNKHDGLEPYMGVDLGNPITHYHRNSDQFTIFAYDGTYFTGSGAFTANPDCQYNLYPTEFTDGGGSSEESYNNTSNNQYWQVLNQQLSTIESLLGSTTGTAFQNLINQIGDVKVEIGQTVLTALQNIDTVDSTSNYNIWVSRADEIVA